MSKRAGLRHIGIIGKPIVLVSFIQNGGFELGTTYWTFAAGASIATDIVHSGVNSTREYGIGEYIQQNFSPSISKGIMVEFSFWLYAETSGANIVAVTIIHDGGVETIFNYLVAFAYTWYKKNILADILLDSTITMVEGIKVAAITYNTERRLDDFVGTYYA